MTTMNKLFRAAFVYGEGKIPFCHHFIYKYTFTSHDKRVVSRCRGGCCILHLCSKENET